MKLKKYISKKLVSRMLLFMGVILFAVLFDAFHEGSDRLANETHHRSENLDLHSSHVFLYNPVSNFKVRTGVDKLFSGFVFACSQNELLTQYHNCRTFHSLKAESLSDRNPFLLMAHFMKFNCCHHPNPDEYPLAA